MVPKRGRSPITSIIRSMPAVRRDAHFTPPRWRASWKLGRAGQRRAYQRTFEHFPGFCGGPKYYIKILFLCSRCNHPLPRPSCWEQLYCIALLSLLKPCKTTLDSAWGRMRSHPQHRITRSRVRISQSVYPLRPKCFTQVSFERFKL